MSHLDDGRIAEWIDAADRPHAQTAHGEVTDHLRQCAVCRERVEEARAIAQRARAILGAATPPVTQAPPFEAVLARAGRATRRRHPAPAWRRLAWAATVVIAGGLGWYVRGAQLQVKTRTDQVASSARAIDSAAPLAAAETRRAEAATGTAGGVAHTPAPGRQTINEAAPAPRQKQQAAADAAAAAKAATREAGADEALRDSGARARALGATPSAPAPAPAPAAAPAPSLRGNVLGVTAAIEEPPATAALAITRDVAERVLGGPVAVLPGLPVERYELLSPGRVVRVLQRLPSGAQLELREWSTAAVQPEGYVARPLLELDRARAAAAGHAIPDTIDLDGIRITAQGPVPADSLKMLLGKIRR